MSNKARASEPDQYLAIDAEPDPDVQEAFMSSSQDRRVRLRGFVHKSILPEKIYTDLYEISSWSVCRIDNYTPQ